MIEFLLGLLLGYIIGIWAHGRVVESNFDGQYEKAVYEWKLNKEKQNADTKN